MLDASQQLHKLQKETRALVRWAEALMGRMASSPLPATLEEAASLLHAHQEIRWGWGIRRKVFLTNRATRLTVV